MIRNRGIPLTSSVLLSLPYPASTSSYSRLYPPSTNLLGRSAPFPDLALEICRSDPIRSSGLTEFFAINLDNFSSTDRLFLDDPECCVGIDVEDETEDAESRASISDELYPDSEPLSSSSKSSSSEDSSPANCLVVASTPSSSDPLSSSGKSSSSSSSSSSASSSSASSSPSLRSSSSTSPSRSSSSSDSSTTAARFFELLGLETAGKREGPA